MEEAKRAKVGDQAKDFVLKDQNEKEFRLAEHKGKKVLLSFHPLAWTSVCAKQMKSLEDNKATFDSLGTAAVGISVDSIPSKKAWADSLGIKEISLLSDFWPHGEVAKVFGIFRDKNGISERANIIVDKNGKIVFIKVYPISELPDIGEIIEFLEK
ncbi:MAG: redoxin domain-containing protein [candidate division Zixibacteria bacterium]|nr:redoxin domain-containing protein [candidate division Zixibacteria bacterium]